MTVLSGSTHRQDGQDIILRSGDFTYLYQPCWAHMPDSFGTSEVVAVACDRQDELYVLTRHKEMPIMVFDREGKFLHSFGKGVFPGRPHGVFINARGELFCTDDTGHIAVKLSKSGEVLAIFGKANQPSDTGCDWDAFRHWREKENIPADRIFDFYFPLQKQIDSIACSAGPFNGPTRMIEGKDGLLYCSDGYGNAAIHRFSPSGEYLGRWGEPGRAPGQFRLPHSVFQDDTKRIWVADRENNRVQIFAPDGELLAIIENLARPTEFCTDGEYIYLSESDAGFSIFSRNIEIVAQFGFCLSPMCFHGLAINSRGDLFGATLAKNKFNNLVKLRRIHG